MPTWKLGYEANCWGALGGDGRGVTSIKDLFYRTFGDPATAAAEIAEAGFQGVEFFDGNLRCRHSIGILQVRHVGQ